MAKNIIIINSLSSGGAERQVSLLLQSLPNLHLILLNGDIHYRIPENVTVSIIKPKRWHSAIETLLIPYYVMKIKKIIPNKSNVISFLNRSNIINVLLKLFVHHNAIISERIYTPYHYQKGLKKVFFYLIKFIYQYADTITANSFGIKEGLVNKLSINPEKVIVINNALDNETLQLQAKEKVNQNVDFFKLHKVILSIGRFEQQKRQSCLIQAFYELSKEHENIGLCLIGEGSQKQRCIDLVHQLGVSKKVLILGKDKNIMKYMSASSCFVLPSEYEGFPNVLIEALFAKLPIISCDCLTGPREILNQETNYQVPYNSVKSCKYGILIPTAMNKEKELITNLRIAIEMILSNSELTNEFKLNAHHRIQPLFIKNIMSEWHFLLKGSGS